MHKSPPGQELYPAEENARIEVIFAILGNFQLDWVNVVLLRILLVALATSSLIGVSIGSEPQPTKEQLEFFKLKVRPILVENCFECHSEKKAEGGLRLDSRKAILEGGDRGPAIELGVPDDSLLIFAMSYQEEDLAMPPEGKLSDEEIDTLTKWIEDLAPWPKKQPKPKQKKKDAP